MEPPGFSFQIVNTNLDEISPRARRRSALLTWQHMASLPPSLPVVYCGGFNTQKESTTGRFLLGRSRYLTITQLNEFPFRTSVCCNNSYTAKLVSTQSVFLYSSNLQRAWCGRGHERRMAKCPSTKKCRPHKNISCFQRYIDSLSHEPLESFISGVS